MLLFTYFELRTGPGRRGHAESYVVLQVHGGADVRRGYTRPRVFTLSDSDDLAMFDFRRATIACKGDPQHTWTTDDGCHWYADGACGHGAGKQLETYEVVGPGAARDTCGPPTVKIVVNESGDGHCARCGAMLDAGC